MAPRPLADRSNSANPLLSAWKSGRTTFGVWSVLPGFFPAELSASMGPDYVCVDQQHSLIDMSHAPAMFQAIAARGSIPLTRVTWNEPGLIGRALDAGAMGVVVPMVDNREQAERAVAACRYPPTGIRSYGPVRANVVLGSSEPRVLEDVACIVMIETETGIANAEEIVTTQGVDAVYIGPSDLALAIGETPAGWGHSVAHRRTLERIREVCTAAGIPVGIQCNDGASARAFAEQGYAMVTIGVDSVMLRTGVTRELAAARGSGADQPGRSDQVTPSGYS